MKPIDQIIKPIIEAGQSGLQTGSTKSQSRPSEKTGLPKEWISALFKRFQVRYGHKFTSSIDGLESVAVDEWAQGLAGLTGAQIKKGLTDWKEPWPPSLPEFRAACEGSSDWEHKSPAYVESRKALPDHSKRAKLETVTEHREKLRKMGINV